MDNKQINRIEKMEANLDEARLAVDKLAEALSGYEEIQDKYYELTNYYGSVQWMDDYESDEEGELPADLKRGVLSEDTVYNLISDHNNLMIRLHKAVLRSLEDE